MAKRRTRGRMSVRIEDGDGPPRDLTTEVEVETSETEVVARVGSVDPPVRSTDPRTIRHYAYLDACSEREAERQVRRTQEVASRFKDQERSRTDRATTPLPRVPCPACGGDLPHCVLCAGEGEVKSELAEAWRRDRWGDPDA